MYYISINLKFFFLIIIFIFGGVVADDCATFEKILKLYENSFGYNHVKDTFVKNGVNNCCDYNGVKCESKNNENHIIEIKFSNLENQSLNQAINDLSTLQYLTTLEIHNTDNFPLNIEKLIYLKTLTVDGATRLEISDKIESMTNLENLYLSNSSYLSEFPIAICKLNNLKALKISKCVMKGTIPFECKNLENIESIDISENTRLEGYIPTFPKLTSCNFKETGLCNLKDSKCTGGRPFCTDKEIQYTNEINGNPNPFNNEGGNNVISSNNGNNSGNNNNGTGNSSNNSNKTDNSIDGKSNKGITIKTILYIAVAIIVIIIVIIFSVFCIIKFKGRQNNIESDEYHINITNNYAISKVPVTTSPSTLETIVADNNEAPPTYTLLDPNPINIPPTTSSTINILPTTSSTINTLPTTSSTNNTLPTTSTINTFPSTSSTINASSSISNNTDGKNSDTNYISQIQIMNSIQPISQTLNASPSTTLNNTDSKNFENNKNGIALAHVVSESNSTIINNLLSTSSTLRKKGHTKPN